MQEIEHDLRVVKHTLVLGLQAGWGEIGVMRGPLEPLGQSTVLPQYKLLH